MKLVLSFLLSCITITKLSAQSYLFYLHGKIIEDQGRNAVDTVNGYGAYQYDDIVNAFKKAGLIVLSEVRQKQTNPFEYAHKVVSQIDSLIKLGVSPANITVVGASKGAVISMFISTYSKNKNLNFVFMGGCDKEIFENFPDIHFYGNILSIYEKSDLEGSCTEFRDRSSKTISHYKEIQLNTGLKHGFLYKPMKEWIQPVISWADSNYH